MQHKEARGLHTRDLQTLPDTARHLCVFNQLLLLSTALQLLVQGFGPLNDFSGQVSSNLGLLTYIYG